MAVRILIGNLPIETSKAHLIELLAHNQAVEAVEIIIDPRTGKNKGFGFIEMSDRVQAEKLAQVLDGMEIHGRQIIANLSESLSTKADASTSFLAKCFRFLHR